MTNKPFWHRAFIPEEGKGECTASLAVPEAHGGYKETKEAEILK